MAMDKSTCNAAVKAAIKSAMSTEYGDPESAYDTFAGILADSISDVIIQHILDNAETSVDAEAIL